MNDTEALGQRLREMREARELTLEDAARLTRIRIKFLEGIERGDYSRMTPVQAQGFLRNYARTLGVDLDLLLSELNDRRGRGVLRRRRGRKRPTPDDDQPTSVSAAYRAYSPRPARQVETGTVRLPVRSAPAETRRQRGVLGNLAIVLVAGGIVVGLVLGTTWLFDELTSTSESGGETVEGTPSTLQTPAPSAMTADGESGPPPAETLEGLPSGNTPPEEDSALSDGGSPPQTPNLPPLDLTGTEVTVVIALTQRTWLRVTVDGVVQQEGLARPGETWIFTGQQSVGVRGSNAAALRLTVNNQVRDNLGARGQLYDETFWLESAIPATSVPPDTGSADGADTSGILPTLTAVLLPPTSPLTATFGFTPTPTQTSAPLVPASPTATHTSTPTGTSSPTPTWTYTPTATLTFTVTPTTTPTSTPSSTPTTTVTYTPSVSPTPTDTPTATPFLPPRLTRTPSPPPK